MGHQFQEKKKFVPWGQQVLEQDSAVCAPLLGIGFLHVAGSEAANRFGGRLHGDRTWQGFFEVHVVLGSLHLLSVVADDEVFAVLGGVHPSLPQVGVAFGGGVEPQPVAGGAIGDVL